MPLAIGKIMTDKDIIESQKLCIAGLQKTIGALHFEAGRREALAAGPVSVQGESIDSLPPMFIDATAWVTPLRYGSKVSFPKPPKPIGWDDDEGEWHCDPLFTADQMRDYARLARTAAPSEGLAIPTDNAVIQSLLEVVRCAWAAMDNTEDDGKSKHWNEPDFDALSNAMDALDALPDDRPGYAMGPAAKAEWALRAPATEQAKPELAGLSPYSMIHGGIKTQWYLRREVDAILAAQVPQASGERDAALEEAAQQAEMMFWLASDGMQISDGIRALKASTTTSTTNTKGISP
jgi:hypothetical protein